MHPLPSTSFARTRQSSPHRSYDLAPESRLQVELEAATRQSLTLHVPACADVLLEPPLTRLGDRDRPRGSPRLLMQQNCLQPILGRLEVLAQVLADALASPLP